MLQNNLQGVETKLKQLYSERGVEKRKCKNAEDFQLFRDSEPEYRCKLVALKERKRKIKEQIKIAERCCAQEISRAAVALDRMFSVDDMEDIADIHDVEVSDNPYREVVVAVEEVAVSYESKTVVVSQEEAMTGFAREDEPMIIVPEPTIEPVTDSEIESSDRGGLRRLFQI